MTQQSLAEVVGIKFQQIQKYETGSNRVSASRLWDIAEALDVPVGALFDGLPSRSAAERDDASPLPYDVLEDKATMDLIRSYHAMPKDQRRRLFELARVLSDVA